MFTHADYMMVVVSNMDESIKFYRDKLGLTLKFESPEWTEFSTGTTTIALHGGGVPAAPNMGSGKTAGICTFGFNVEDLESAYHDLKAKGVRFVMPPTTQPNEGIKLAVAVDPDGLGISFAELLKKI